MADVVLDPFQEIIEVGWSTQLFAVVEATLYLGNFGRLRLSTEAEQVGFGTNLGFPTEMDAPDIEFPPTAEMLAYYRSWFARKNDFPDPDVLSTTQSWIVNVGKTGAGDPFEMRMSFSDNGVLALGTRVNIWLFEHHDFKIALPEEPAGPALTNADDAAASIFDQELLRATEALYTEVRILISPTAKTASLLPAT